MELLTIKDVFQYPFVTVAVHPEGLFMPNFMNQTFLPVTLRGAPNKLTQIDIWYFGTRNEKIVSPLVNALLNSGFTKTQILSRISEILISRFSIQWKKLFDTYILDYEPIENYNSTETMTDDITTHQHGETETKSFTNRETDHVHGKIETQSFTNRETEHKRTANLSTVDAHDVSGFNSSSLVAKDKNTKTETGTDTNTDKETGTETLTNSGTDTDKEKGSETLAHSGTDTDTRNYTLTRTGNIGVTTSQQMIKSEIDLWGGIEIFEQYIFPEIDKLLTIPLY